MNVVNLEVLKRNGALWQGRRNPLAPERALGTGWPVLDEMLGGGWPRAALTEILGEAHQGLPLLLPLLARLSQGPRWLVWVSPPYLPYAPALAARGICLERLLLVRDVASAQALWAAEQALRSGVCATVLMWPGQLTGAQLRRLQLAAEQGDCSGVLFRPLRAAKVASPATVRLRVRPAPLGLEAELLRRRGAWGGARCIVPVSGGGEDVVTETPTVHAPVV